VLHNWDLEYEPVVLGEVDPVAEEHTAESVGGYEILLAMGTIHDEEALVCFDRGIVFAQVSETVVAESEKLEEQEQVGFHHVDHMPDSVY
jgi:hypothetical protein